MIEIYECVEVIPENNSVAVTSNYKGFYGTDEKYYSSGHSFMIKEVKRAEAIESNSPKKDKFISDHKRYGYIEEPRDPLYITMVKSKKFVVADEMVNSVFESKSSLYDGMDHRALKDLLIALSTDARKLNHDLNSQAEIIDNYRNENAKLEENFRFLKKMDIFQRLFCWKQIKETVGIDGK